MLAGGNQEKYLEGFTPFKYGFDMAVGLTTKNKKLLGISSKSIVGKQIND